MYRCPPGKPGGRVDAGLDGLDRRGSAGLAVRRVLAAARAELRQLHAVGVVAPVLLGDVVALLAHRAGERDLRANVAGLAGHGLSFCRAGRGRDEVLATAVVGAGLEPATPRL